MPYGKQVEKALNAIRNLNINMIAPSHGIIWRSHIPKIIEKYSKWSQYNTDKKALIIYDSMWGSTEKIAYTLRNGIEDSGIPVTIRNLKTNHISDVIKDLLLCKMILIGSPTLNNTMLPTIGAFLTYLKGLRPKNRIGFVFGSYGWGGQAVNEIEKIIKELSWDKPFEGINLKFIPDNKKLIEVEKIGQKLGKYLIKK
jgi:flavorubredoxin